MGMGVNKPRRDDQAGCIDDLLRAAGGLGADIDDAICADGYVAPERGRVAGVDRAAANDDVCGRLLRRGSHQPGYCRHCQRYPGYPLHELRIRHYVTTPVSFRLWQKPYWLSL